MRCRLAGWGLAVVLAGAPAGCDSTEPPPAAPSTPAPVPPAAVTTTAPPALSPPPKLFDHAAVADGVRRVLTENFGVTELGAVACPPGQPVRTGHAFECQARIGAEQRPVTITVQNDEGLYSVGAPG